jgi:two-component system sensor histidine kinase ChvG
MPWATAGPAPSSTDSHAVPGLKLSIRTKVLLVAVLLLTIPYVGYQFVREMENHLRDALEQSVLGAAQALAGALHDRPDLVPEPPPGDASAPVAGEIYAHPLPQDMQIDGYLEDWGAHLGQLRPLGGGSGGTQPPWASFVAGKRGPYLYLLVTVKDALIVDRGLPVRAHPGADYVKLVTVTAGGLRRAYFFHTISAGWITPYELTDGDARSPSTRLRQESRIRAEWRETRDGYVVEARIPLALLGERVGIEVGDVDDPATHADPVRLSSFAASPRAQPGLLVLPSESIEALIKSLGRTPGRRIWVVDAQQRVLARGGSLERETEPVPVNPLFALVLRPPPAEMFEEQPIVARYSGPEVRAALAGRATSRWRTTEHPGTYVVSAAHPVWNGANIVAAVVVEEATLGIQTVRREALANLFNKTLVVCFFGALVLLAFATRISMRLRRLRNEAAAAIDAHGRVVGALSASRAGDEIGDLARDFSAMMKRLREYNHYLEQLARRLSHELRTPITVVRSSLEAMELEQSPGDQGPYLARARDGVRRLDTIISRMSEATRLEQALQDCEPETFDLGDVVAAALESYRSAWPEKIFHYQACGEPCPIHGMPDLIVQMLDKLVANAVDFSTPETSIDVSVARRANSIELEVRNQGPLLPEEMADKLFQSMVSIREDKGPENPHLGLGLYIVRLIAEAHGARAKAFNLPNASGVGMQIVFPALSRG